MAEALVEALGQSGFRFTFGRTVVFIDPYLSDHVEEVEGNDMRRLVPVHTPPEAIEDADWVLSTHIHLDHADPKTLVPISLASPECRFLCPNEVARSLIEFGISKARVEKAREEWISLGREVRAIAIPAAHTAIERDDDGFLRFVGYLFEFGGRRLYHAGDTSPDRAIVGTLADLGPVDVAFLPVNERNYYRDRRGIIGNMSLREAFEFACEIGARKVIPMHWDMFRPNTVYREEIELYYRLEHPPFEMAFNPTRV